MTEQKPENATTEKNNKDGDGEVTVQERQASQISLCDSGKTFGSRRCAAKVKDTVNLLTEERLLLDAGLAAIPPFGAPMSTNLRGLHPKKYSERLKELVCTLPVCFGRGFTCAYDDVISRYCHIHMAAAMDQEVKTRQQLPSAHEYKDGSLIWDDDDVWNQQPGTWSRRNIGEWVEFPTQRVSRGSQNPDDPWD